MDAYVVLGDPYAGKSTLIRHLSGRARTGIAMMEIGGSYQDVYVQMGSLQEGWIEPRAFVQDAVNSGADCVLVAVWIRGRRDHNWPPGDAYLTTFKQAGWTIKQVQVLSDQPLPTAYAQWDPKRRLYHRVTNRPPSNSTAATVRSRWKWR